MSFQCDSWQVVAVADGKDGVEGQLQDAEAAEAAEGEQATVAGKSLQSMVLQSTPGCKCILESDCIRWRAFRFAPRAPGMVVHLWSAV